MVVTTSYPPQTSQGVVTSWLPLTTTFTPPAGCSNSFQLSGLSGRDLVAYDPRYGLSVDSKVKCQPSVVTKSYQSPQFLSSNVLVQQGIMPMVCPLGWETLASSVRDETSTLAMCCPPGYYLGKTTPGFFVGTCASTVTSGATLSYASAPNGKVKSWVVQDMVIDQLTTVEAVAVIGWNIGSPGAPSSAPVTSASSSTPSTASTPTSSTSAPSPISKEPSGGLSIGARAGIGVGATVGGIGLIALLILCLICRRPQVPPPRSPRITQPPESIKEVPPTPILPTHEIEGRNRGHELQAQSTGYELPGERGGELPGEPRLPPYEPPAELP